MPIQDPPQPADGLPSLRRRFWRIMRWATLFSALVAAVAVMAVAKGDSEFHLHMVIATALGVGLTMLLGIGLMTLVFLSNSSGHDRSAADHSDKDKK